MNKRGKFLKKVLSKEKYLSKRGLFLILAVILFSLPLISAQLQQPTTENCQKFQTDSNYRNSLSEVEQFLFAKCGNVVTPQTTNTGSERGEVGGTEKESEELEYPRVEKWMFTPVLSKKYWGKFNYEDVTANEVLNTARSAEVECTFLDSGNAECISEKLDLLTFRGSVMFDINFKMEFDGSKVTISDCKKYEIPKKSLFRLFDEKTKPSQTIKIMIESGRKDFSNNDVALLKVLEELGGEDSYKRLAYWEKVNWDKEDKERVLQLLNALTHRTNNLEVKSCKGKGEADNKVFLGNLRNNGIPILGKIWGIRNIPVIGSKPILLKPKFKHPEYASGDMKLVLYQLKYEGKPDYYSRERKIVIRDLKWSLKRIGIIPKASPTTPKEKKIDLPPQVANLIGDSIDISNKNDFKLSIQLDKETLEKELLRFQSKKELDDKDIRMINGIIDALDIFINGAENKELEVGIISDLNSLKSKYRGLLGLPKEGPTIKQRRIIIIPVKVKEFVKNQLDKTKEVVSSAFYNIVGTPAKTEDIKPEKKPQAIQLPAKKQPDDKKPTTPVTPTRTVTPPGETIEGGQPPEFEAVETTTGEQGAAPSTISLPGVAVPDAPGISQGGPPTSPSPGSLTASAGGGYSGPGGGLWNPPDNPDDDCQETWLCTDWGICADDISLRKCTDTASCGTFEKKPIEGKDCNLPGPGPTCNENWVCSDWTDCFSGFTYRTCTDVNSCGSVDSKPIENDFCIDEKPGKAPRSTAEKLAVWIFTLLLLIGGVLSWIYYQPFKEKGRR